MRSFGVIAAFALLLVTGIQPAAAATPSSIPADSPAPHAITLGGTNFQLTTGVYGPGGGVPTTPPLLTWNTGAGQSGYQIPSMGGFFREVQILPLPQGSTLSASATSYQDTRSANRLDYCYTLAVLGAAGSVLANSDVLCQMPASGIGANAGAVTIGLDQTLSTTLNWTGPTFGTPTLYFLDAVDPFTGTTQTAVVPATQHTFVHNTNGDPYCYLVVALGAPGGPSAPDITCAFPGLSNFPTTPAAPQATGGKPSVGISMDQALENVGQKMLRMTGK